MREGDRVRKMERERETEMQNIFNKRNDRCLWHLLVVQYTVINLYQCLYTALFTFMVGWQARTLDSLQNDVIFAQPASQISKENIDCLRFVMCPLLTPHFQLIFLFFSFLLRPQTVLMRQTRQAVQILKVSKIDCFRFVMCPLLVPVLIGFFYAVAIINTNEANKAGGTHC